MAKLWDQHRHHYKPVLQYGIRIPPIMSSRNFNLFIPIYQQVPRFAWNEMGLVCKGKQL